MWSKDTSIPQFQWDLTQSLALSPITALPVFLIEPKMAPLQAERKETISLFTNDKALTFLYIICLLGLFYITNPRQFYSHLNLFAVTFSLPSVLSATTWSSLWAVQ